MYRIQVDPRQAIVPVAGQRVYSRLQNAVQTHAVRITVAAQLDVTVAGTLLNDGSFLAAFDEIGIENGAELQLWDPRTAAFVGQWSAPSSVYTRRATGAGVQATTLLREQVILYCAHPYSLNPRETALMERNIQSFLNVFVKLNATNNGVAKLIGAGTGTLTNITVEVEQEYDAFESDLPDFQVQVRSQVEQVNAANGQQEAYIRTPNFLRAIVLSEETSGAGNQSDILTSFALRAQGRDYIGPQLVRKTNWQQTVGQQAGGLVYDVAGGARAAHTMLWFQKNARLANVLSPVDTNLKLVMNVAPSAAAGQVASSIRITLIELVRDPYLDQGTGRRVCSEKLSFPV